MDLTLIYGFLHLAPDHLHGGTTTRVVLTLQLRAQLWHPPGGLSSGSPPAASTSPN